MAVAPKRILEELASGLRISKFMAVGVVGAVFDTGVLVVLTEVFGVLPEIATVIGIEVAILVMFILNERWTFSEVATRNDSFIRRIFRSHLVRLSGSFTQFVVFLLIYRVLYTAVFIYEVDMWLFVAKVGGIGIGMAVNYVFESLFTWKVTSSSI